MGRRLRLGLTRCVVGRATETGCPAKFDQDDMGAPCPDVQEGTVRLFARFPQAFYKEG